METITAKWQWGAQQPLTFTEAHYVTSTVFSDLGCLFYYMLMRMLDTGMG